jgi:cellulose synthase/poly-beta-1,6-N-acetylglucosamine synthase-like glycosyltransferase
MSTLLILLILPLLLPAWAMGILTLAALIPPSKRCDSETPPNIASPRVAVLVPAHNESHHVLPTIACLRLQLGTHDRLLVVADNCNDDTASLARQAGAEVVERHHATLRGKGYALAFGVDHLRADPPDVLVVVDADCTVSTHALAQMSAHCQSTGHPVQILNLMHTEAGAGLKLRMMEFAMVMKNQVRPRGSFRLGQACHLMGTGMALPWSLAAQAQLATGHVAEDMKLGVEMAKAGLAPHFLETVEVSSAFVTNSSVARVQKSRWEHGHLATMSEELPQLLRAAWQQRSKALTVMSLDLLIPPLALYFMVLVGVTALVLGLSAWSKVAQPAAVFALWSAGVFGSSVLLAWWRFGRHLLSGGELLTAPLYAAWKLPVYLAYALKKRSGWVRTKRE